MSQASHVTSMMPAMRRRGVAMPLPGGMTREWGWLFGIAVVDLLWCWRIGMTFTQISRPLLTMAALMGVCIGCRYWRRAPRVADACEAVAYWIGFSLAGCILTYLFATWAFPLRDTVYDRMDAALGFDWLTWKSLIVAHPPLHRLLALIYASLRLQILLAVIYFAFAGQRQNNDVLLRAAFISLMITTVISGFMPALTVFALYGMPAEAPWLHDLVALRAGALSFAVPDLKGVIDMPSYHAVLAVLLAWSFRRGGIIGVTVGLWDLLMLVSVLSEGGHYLVDLVAGVVVAAMAIWLARATLPDLDRHIADATCAPTAAGWR
jgi:hypothetical protein